MTICTHCLDKDLPGYDREPMAADANPDLKAPTLVMVDTLPVQHLTWLSKVGDQLQFRSWESTKVVTGISLAGSASVSYEIIADASLDKTPRGTAVPESR